MLGVSLIIIPDHNVEGGRVLQTPKTYYYSGEWPFMYQIMFVVFLGGDNFKSSLLKKESQEARSTKIGYKSSVYEFLRSCHTSMIYLISEFYFLSCLISEPSIDLCSCLTLTSNQEQSCWYPIFNIFYLLFI